MSVRAQCQPPAHGPSALLTIPSLSGSCLFLPIRVVRNSYHCLPASWVLLLSCPSAVNWQLPDISPGSVPHAPSYSPGCPSGAIRPHRTHRLSSSQLHFLSPPPPGMAAPDPGQNCGSACRPVPSPSGPAPRALSSASSPPSRSSSPSILTAPDLVQHTFTSCSSNGRMASRPSPHLASLSASFRLVLSTGLQGDLSRARITLLISPVP